MESYLDKLNDEVREYFSILSNEFPEWLLDYINTKEMQRIGTISMSCGTDYSKTYNNRYWYSNLDHSVGVALIIWNFTHDKKQTLAGLFHDIATPCFKHCIDFMNGDHEKQESTEERTTDIIKNSIDIMNLLKRDGITLEEVNDYKKYPIADNDSPKLSADRFEYNFSSGLVFHRVWNLEDIKICYENIEIMKNENNIDEIGFKDKKVAEKYIHIVSKLWPEWISNKDKLVMQFLADVVKIMHNKGLISLDDLYTLSEKEIIDKIINCGDDKLVNSFNKFMNNTEVYESETPVSNCYCININSKRRYVDPLATEEYKASRISKVSVNAKKDIDKYLNTKTIKYTYYDFPLEYTKEKVKVLNN